MEQHQHQYLTIPEVAKLSALSENYLRLQTRSGDLAHSRCGRAIRVSVSDFEAFMAAHRVGGKPLEIVASRNAPASGIRAVR